MPRLLKTGIGPIVVGLALLINLQFHLMITPALAAEDNSENKWWVALGAILAGGTVAALASGGGSENDNNGNDGTFSSDW